MPERSREKLRRRGLAALACAVLLLGSTAPGPAAEPIVLEATREPLNADNRTQTRVGALAYRGGLSIRSPDRRFGGLSGLLVEPDGSALLAVTDAGSWISIPLVHDAAGRLTGLGAGRIGHLPGLDGRRMSGKRAQDAEALTRLGDGTLVVAFEQNHRLWRYPPGDPPFAGRPERMLPPPGLVGLPSNNGLEALVALDDDGMLALPQNHTAGRFPAYLWGGRHWQILAYPALGGFDPSGATRLPDGDLVILERSYSLIGGIAVRLMRLPADQLGASGRLRPQELGVLRPPLTLDNYEAIDSRTGPSGETLVYILSDDNFSPWQRTLLLLFALED